MQDKGDSGATQGKLTGRSRPRSEEEQRQRELEWIRRDVELYAPRGRQRTSGERTTASMTAESVARASSSGGRAVAGDAGADSPTIRQPMSSEERERREKLWISKEADRLRQSLETKRRASSRPEQSQQQQKQQQQQQQQHQHQQHQHQNQQHQQQQQNQHQQQLQQQRSQQPLELKRFPNPASEAELSSRHDLVQQLSAEEIERREVAWIRRDVELHASLRNSRCSSINAASSQAAVSACRRLAATATPGGAAWPVKSSNLSVSEAAGKVQISQSSIDEIKAKLASSIPEDVIDRELPWILEDIALGQNLMKRRGETN
eukprot:TRINITY_DN16281_c0_g4_i1.p1 TRINITY_DN16281_c0_g4~~TRINITY_DN16281_c0_g4_i1.p1  ORF type:complete len:319 (-),score=93.44 TRINITY_DN16281_c0_g4_i1:55-1011(-)